MEELEKVADHETIEHIKSDDVVEIDRAAEKRLLWKLDIHVVPILMFLFLLAFLDRINIGNARLQGLEKDLNMKNNDYNIALFIFFIPYILFEVPSNFLLKRIAPSWWISGIMFGWGKFYFGHRSFMDCVDANLSGEQASLPSAKDLPRVSRDWLRVGSCWVSLRLDSCQVIA
jgi:hypothetical protein